MKAIYAFYIWDFTYNGEWVFFYIYVIEKRKQEQALQRRNKHIDKKTD